MNQIPRYRPVGRCIYCFKQAEGLSKEHIIPYGLNGHLILPAASCKQCAAVTSKIEFELLRGEMHQVRAALSFPTRRKKGKPKSFNLFVTRNGIEEAIDVPISDHLLFLPLPLYRDAAFVKPYDYQKGIALIGMQTIQFGDKEKILKKFQAEKIGVVMRLDKDLFARLLAKMAYAMAVATYGLDRIKTVYVLPIIFGDMSEAGKWIGSSEREHPPVAPDMQHLIHLQTFTRPGDIEPRTIIVALIKLFANIPSPGYYVIVGELEDGEK